MLLWFILVLFCITILWVIGFVVVSSLLTCFQDPFVSTPDKALERLLKILPVHLRGKKTFYELGAGRGKVSLAMARRFPRLKVFAVEKSKFLCRLIELGARHQALKNLRVLHRDLFQVSLKKADILYLYLSPRSFKRLTPRFNQLKKGALIITLDFPLPGRKAFKKLPVSSHRLFLYRG